MYKILVYKINKLIFHDITESLDTAEKIFSTHKQPGKEIFMMKNNHVIKEWCPKPQTNKSLKGK
jgi:hypothetical protein